MTFGRWLAAGTGLIVLVAILERYDERLAFGLAVVTLLAILFHNPQAVNQISALLARLTSPLPPNERT